MDYVVSLLNRIGVDVEILSLSRSKRSGWSRGSRRLVHSGLRVRMLPSIGNATFVHRRLDHWLANLLLGLHLLISVPSGTTLIVYHSLAYGPLLRFIKAMKRFILIMEVEEIYHHVVPCSERTTRSEWASIRAADAYILPTTLLAKDVNPAGRPALILHGSYTIAPGGQFAFDDEHVHVVYAGTLDPRKGALAAVQAARHLSPEYHVHVLGYGSVEDGARVRNAIRALERATAGERVCAKVTFEGMLTGKRLDGFLSACHVGLCPQDPTASFSSSSFPSKILTYLSHGLKVVGVRIRAIEESALKDCVEFYDGNSPLAIAAAIKRATGDSRADCRGRLQELDAAAMRDMGDLLRVLKR